jgi:DNA-binding MarR family transcriptional regulator
VTRAGGERARRSAAARDRNLLRIHEFTELIAASARSARQRERVLRAAGLPLTDANLAALRLVHRHGPIAVSEVARRLGVDPSTASRQLRPLEEHGLIARKNDDEDRRVAWLAITDAGRDAMAKIRAVALNDFDVALSDWSRADRARLGALLERFRIGLLEARADETGWSVRKEKSGSRRA